MHCFYRGRQKYCITPPSSVYSKTWLQNYWIEKRTAVFLVNFFSPNFCAIFAFMPHWFLYPFLRIFNTEHDLHDILTASLNITTGLTIHIASLNISTGHRKMSGKKSSCVWRKLLDNGHSCPVWNYFFCKLPTS